MSQKEPKKSNKKQKSLDINHEFLINFEKTEEKSQKNLRKPKNEKNLYEQSKIKLENIEKSKKDT